MGKKQDIIEKIVAETVGKPTTQEQLEEAARRIKFVEEQIPDDDQK